MSRSKPNAISKRGKFRLSAAMAEVMSDEELARWLREIMAGRDPDAPEADGTADGSEPEAFAAFANRPTWVDRMRAAKLFLAYRNGQPTQSVVIEEARASQASSAGSEVVKAVLTVLDNTEQSHLRKLLAKAQGRRVLDVPSTPVAAPAAEAVVIAGERDETQ